MQGLNFATNGQGLLLTDGLTARFTEVRNCEGFIPEVGLTSTQDDGGICSTFSDLSNPLVLYIV